jgi:hypothetical protein
MTISSNDNKKSAVVHVKGRQRSIRSVRVVVPPQFAILILPNGLIMPDNGGNRWRFSR